MRTAQETTENEINAPASSTQLSGEPKSAHATPVAEKYVEKRKEKAKKQTEEQHKADSLWSAIKYVIL